jgi:hypothetical protein
MNHNSEQAGEAWAEPAAAELVPPVPQARPRTWPVRLLGLLLLLQAFGTLVPIVLASRLASIDWRAAVEFLPYRVEDVPVEDQRFVMLILVFGPLCLALAVSGLLTGLLLRLGWLLAMISQSVLLLATLTLHFRGDFQFVDPLMTSAIVMVLVLNAAYVRETLMPAPGQDFVLEE